uniref:UPF0301 protein BECKMB1821G_GA0114241_10046 n=1 Tax=Candidatus Kentrum sp. MB TaxID=2138164 RepID=A0A451B7F7_9GAMM|nr:MAG: putative transcriptional regulator [Candidatus Kentron sp. MB]VFK28320.1 MAG: putative transcriptional regulator [Candidatus Kentron sp. MB]VFK74204.1 MAG: putative transcriptional regulator [Candidatus Kentron sp. MB]
MDLTNHLLIAMPTLEDPNFHRTVTYLCAHTQDGAMGFVINRPLGLGLGEVLKHMDMEVTDPAVNYMRVFHGGPIQPERGFVIHSPAGEWESMLPVGDDIGVATSRDILAAIAEGTGPENVVVALGYAGWGAGQLEKEITENSWLTSPVDSRIIFEVPFEKRWQTATRMLGIDPVLLSREVGHG